MSKAYHWETNEEGEGLKKVAGQYKVSRKAEQRRRRAITAIIFIVVAVYLIAAILYNYSIAINITLK